jgi:hypothetical protein
MLREIDGHGLWSRHPLSEQASVTFFYTQHMHLVAPLSNSPAMPMAHALPMEAVGAHPGAELFAPLTQEIPTCRSPRKAASGQPNSMPKILPLNQPSALVDDAWLDQLQRAAFEYFPSNTNPSNGLVADTSRDGSPVSIAVVGLALSCYPVAVERGWMGRDEAARYCLAALRFFSASDQSGTPSATGYQGFYFHFLDMHTGTRVWQSELSMIDTAILLEGVVW